MEVAQRRSLGAQRNAYNKDNALISSHSVVHRGDLRDALLLAFLADRFCIAHARRSCQRDACGTKFEQSD